MTGSVLGEKGSSGDHRASILTSIHNATIAAERERIHADHPGEEEATLHNRVLGALEPTRGALCIISDMREFPTR